MESMFLVYREVHLIGYGEVMAFGGDDGEGYGSMGYVCCLIKNTVII